MLVLAAGLAAALGVVVTVALSTGSGSTRYLSSGGVPLARVIPEPQASRRSSAKRPPPFHPDQTALRAAAKLPLTQQVAQLFLVTLQGKTASAAADLGAVDWGGVVFDSSNFASDTQASSLTTQITLAARARGRLAPLVAATQEGGGDTAFADLPPASEPVIGASGTPRMARAEAARAARRLRALGFNMTLAPLADVDTPGGALSGRLFGTDPVIVARMVKAAVRGYRQAHVISAVGHFPGSGGASADPDQMPATVGGSLSALRARDLIPFSAVLGSAPVVMMSNASYVALDGVTPASLDSQAIGLLRHGLGFQGVVMSDDLDATLQATGQSPGDAAVQALEAGDDLLYISGAPSEHMQAYDAVLSAAQRQPRVRAEVRDAVLRVLSLKARFGVLGQNAAGLTHP